MARFVIFLLFFLTAAAMSGSAQATTLKELQLGIRTVGYMLDPPRGRTGIAVLFDSQVPQSEADGRKVREWILSEASLPNIELEPVLLDVAKLDQAQPYRIAIVTSGLAAQYDRIFNYARTNGTLTITADLDCVRAAKCAVGVALTPALGVFINHTVTSACTIDFLAGFRMMVKEF